MDSVANRGSYMLCCSLSYLFTDEIQTVKIANIKPLESKSLLEYILYIENILLVCVMSAAMKCLSVNSKL